MPALRIEIAPERVAEGRRRYENTLVPVDDIAVAMGVSPTTLRNRIKEWGWTRRRNDSRPGSYAIALRAAVPSGPLAAEPALPPPSPDAPQDRATVAARIQDLVARELTSVERVLAVTWPSDAGEAERSARTLASIARTLREIALIHRAGETTAPDVIDDDPIPRDIDEFRRELARRIHAFVDGRTGAGVSNDSSRGVD